MENHKCSKCHKLFKESEMTKCEKCNRYYCYICVGIPLNEIADFSEGICPDCQDKYDIHCKCCKR